MVRNSIIVPNPLQIGRVSLQMSSMAGLLDIIGFTVTFEITVEFLIINFSIFVDIDFCFGPKLKCSHLLKKKYIMAVKHVMDFSCKLF